VSDQPVFPYLKRIAKPVVLALLRWAQGYVSANWYRTHGVIERTRARWER
jgi:hypothetical protein